MKSLILSVLVLTLSGVAVTEAAQQADAGNFRWVGCGITKKAFMSGLATAYEEETGIKIDIQGGGATKGIREVSRLGADMGFVVGCVIVYQVLYADVSDHLPEYATLRAIAGTDTSAEVEVGYQWLDVSGNEDMYRTQINEDSGVVLDNVPTAPAPAPDTASTCCH